jgi:hypothetical protein
MFAIAKRLWQGIKAQHITVKGAAFSEVSYKNGDMIKNRLLWHGLSHAPGLTISPDCIKQYSASA